MAKNRKRFLGSKNPSDFLKIGGRSGFLVPSGAKNGQIWPLKWPNLGILAAKAAKIGHFDGQMVGRIFPIFLRKIGGRSGFLGRKFAKTRISGIFRFRGKS